jgi:peroxiredoxin family protein
MDYPNPEVALAGAKAGDRVTIVVHSYSMDKLYSALIIGTGALSMNMEVALYFTFWGLKALQKNGLAKAPLSSMHMFGLGKWMMQRMMRRSKVASLERLMADYLELGGRVIACDMTMQIMGIKKEMLRQDWVTDCGAVGTYLNEARQSTINLIV